MEVIELAGYTEEEKLKIANVTSCPSRSKNHGLTHEQIQFTDGGAAPGNSATLTKPASEISNAKSHRSAARSRGDGRGQEGADQDHTGHGGRDPRAPRFFDEEMQKRTKNPGVAIGLAWTPVGGDVLFIEASRMPGTRLADANRSARRRHEGIGASGALVAARRTRRNTELTGLLQAPTSTFTCRRGQFPRTARRPA